MQKLFSTLAVGAGTASIVLAAWMLFNGMDRQEAQTSRSEALQRLEALQFDEQFASISGQQLTEAQRKRNAELRARLEAQIDKADQQAAAATAARHKARDTLDGVLTEMDAGTLKAESPGPSPIGFLVAGVLLAAIGLGLRKVGRKDSTADDEQAKPALRFIDRVVDRISGLFSTKPATGEQAKGDKRGARE